MKNQTTSTILERTVGIEPTGVIYTVKGSDIEAYAESYLQAKQVSGVSEVKVRVRNEGRTHPEVAIYLFMAANSNLFESQKVNIAPMLRDKIEQSLSSTKIDDNFKKILFPLCGNEIHSGKAQNKEFWVKLDIFRVCGMMFSVDPRRHDLVISEAKTITGRDSILSVIKYESFTNIRSNNGDDYARQIDMIERRNR